MAFYLMPACCHGGILKKIVFFSFIFQPPASDGYTGFVKIVPVFRSYRPAVPVHGSVFTAVVVFFAGTLQPSGETFTIGSAVIIVSFVFKRTADHPALGIVEITGSMDLAPSCFLRCDADRSGFLPDIGGSLYGNCMNCASRCAK